MGKMKVLLLLDDVSKSMIKTNISVMSSRGVTIITTLNEITEDMLKDTRTVIILEGYAMCAYCLSDIRLYKALMGLSFIYIGLDNRWMQVMSQAAECYQADISLLSIDIVQAAYYKDMSFENRDAASAVDDRRALAAEIVGNRMKHTADEAALADALLSVLERERAAEEELDQLQEHAADLENRAGLLERDNESLLEGYSKIVRDAIKMNAALKQYETIFTKNIYQKVNAHSYNERPQIIYLKEHEYFLGLDQLLETLYGVFRIQNRQSVKVLRLYDSSGCRQMLTLPGYYKVLSNRYLSKDIDANDYICKSGDYVRILEMLLLNRLHLDVLIIADCKDHNDLVLAGDVLVYNLCQRYSSFKPLGLSEDNTVTNTRLSGSSVLQWNDYELADFSPDERFITLSARPVVQDMLLESRRFQTAY